MWPIRVAILAMTLMVIGGLGYWTYLISKNLGLGNIVSMATNFVIADESLTSSFLGRTNVLVMGIGGEGHEGSNLTDTMFMVSVSINKPSVVVISIPRDIWIPSLRAKINSAYYWGKVKNAEGGGVALVRGVAEEVLGTQIQYTAIIDFSGFIKIIDVLGGVDVDVKKSFTDTMYPIAGREEDKCNGDPLFRCRYESITFTSGVQNMNGETALKFVRSRHSQDDEGTDIARNARQVVVIRALVTKMLNPATLINFRNNLFVFAAIKDSIETDMDNSTLAIIARKVFDARENIENYSIPEDLLFNPPISNFYDRQYVFIPRAGNGVWSEINSWAQRILYGGAS